MKYASIIPLIGGENFGIQTATGGELPQYVLSYKAFAKNDSHYIEHLRKNGWTGDYIHLDEAAAADYTPAKVDVVNSVCPCAGLSSFSTKSSVDSATNDWLYTTAEYVCSRIRPRVFWGENAPRLSSESGRKVADKLYEIGAKYGYSLTLYYTESRCHGLSQKRPRTFYFFTDSPRAHIFPRWNVEPRSISEILQRDIHADDPMNILTNREDPKSNPWVAYNMAMTGTSNMAELAATFSRSENLIVYADGGYGKNLNDVADWMDAHGHTKTANRAREMQKKRDAGKGYWSHGVTMPSGDVIPALIGAIPFWLINPYKESYLTIRDCLRIMGMPDDFNLTGSNPYGSINHICQNVPVSTARDMALGVMAYLDGTTRESSGSYIVQNNKNGSVVHRDVDKASLEEFF